MRFQAPLRWQNWFYLGYDHYPWPGDERFGVSIGRFYLGYSDKWFHQNGTHHPAGWCFGRLGKDNMLIERR
jgi:hypothetical protein